MSDEDKQYIRDALSMAFGVICTFPPSGNIGDVLEKCRRALVRLDKVTVTVSSNENRSTYAKDLLE